jgi:hypothetical protein
MSSTIPGSDPDTRLTMSIGACMPEDWNEAVV